jgi:hypothetical protein
MLMLITTRRRFYQHSPSQYMHGKAMNSRNGVVTWTVSPIPVSAWFMLTSAANREAISTNEASVQSQGRPFKLTAHSSTKISSRWHKLLGNALRSRNLVSRYEIASEDQMGGPGEALLYLIALASDHDLGPNPRRARGSLA